jgi:hypothetical protein
MSAQAGIFDARQLGASQDPAQTAVIVIEGRAEEIAQDEIARELADAAINGGMLVISVSLLPADATAWLGAATPGGAEGCSLHPGSAPNLVKVRSDRAGHFLASNLGLILRSNGVRAVVLAGNAPADFAATRAGATTARTGATGSRRARRQTCSRRSNSASTRITRRWC